MAKRFLVNLDLGGASLLNPVLNPLASAPANANPFYVYTSTANDDKGTIYSNVGTYASPVWKALGAVTSVNGKAGIVVLTQDDVGDGTTYKRTHNDLTDALVTLINGALQKSGGTMSGAIAMGGNKITGLADGTSDGDAVTKKQLDAAKLGALKPSGSVTFANLPFLSESVLNDIYNVTDPFTTTADFAEGAGVAYPAGTNVAIINTGTDASPVYKYDAYTGVIDFSPYLKKDGTVAMTGSLSMGSNKITGLGTPTADTDAATKKYVDDTVAGVVKTATATIGTSATTATVNYSGTLINAYATMGGAKVELDVAVAATSVTFTTAVAPSAAVTCTVVYS